MGTAPKRGLIARVQGWRTNKTLSVNTETKPDKIPCKGEASHGLASAGGFCPLSSGGIADESDSLTLLRACCPVLRFSRSSQARHLRGAPAGRPWGVSAIRSAYVRFRRVVVLAPFTRTDARRMTRAGVMRRRSPAWSTPRGGSGALVIQ